jgi:excisionase family DNA binding protein
MKEVNSPWLTIDEGAAYVRKGRTTFRQLVRGGEVPSYDMGGMTLVNRDELNAWVRSHPSGACEVAQAMGA